MFQKKSTSHLYTDRTESGKGDLQTLNYMEIPLRLKSLLMMDMCYQCQTTCFRDMTYFHQRRLHAYLTLFVNIPTNLEEDVNFMRINMSDGRILVPFTEALTLG
jgi:hypothetical protein